MKKYRFIALTGLALVALVVIAACAPGTVPTAAPGATSAPTQAAAGVTPIATPEIVATQAVTDTTAGQATPAGSAESRPTVPAPQGDERPLAKLEPAEREDMFGGPAATYVKPDTVYMATIVTDKGNIVAELYQDTPESLNNFVTLALNGYFDGLTFHRVEPGFVIQGGDPAGTGQGGPGYTIPAEIIHEHPRGALAWARTSDEVNPERESSGSQFYVTLAPTEFLNGAYSVFGQVTEGMDVADKIAVGDKIQRIDIAEAEASQIPTPTITPTASVTPTPTQTPTPFAPSAQDGRPLATVTAAERQGYYNTAPAMALDITKAYQATVETDKGSFVIDLDVKNAPQSVNNFVMLANLGFYDGLPVAYNDPNSYLVLGSPQSQPNSDVGYTIPLEDTATATEIITGTVGLYPVQVTQTEWEASGSEFIVLRVQPPTGALPPVNSLGKVNDEGMKVVGELAAGDIIKSITISEK